MKTYLFIFHSDSLGFLPNEYIQSMIVRAVNSTEARRKFLEYLKITNINDSRLDYVNYEDITDPDIISKN